MDAEASDASKGLVEDEEAPGFGEGGAGPGPGGGGEPRDAAPDTEPPAQAPVNVTRELERAAAGLAVAAVEALAGAEAGPRHLEQAVAEGAAWTELGLETTAAGYTVERPAGNAGDPFALRHNATVLAGPPADPEALAAALARRNVTEAEFDAGLRGAWGAVDAALRPLRCLEGAELTAAECNAGPAADPLGGLETDRVGGGFLCGLAGVDPDDPTKCRADPVPASDVFTAMYINITVGVLCFLGFGLLRNTVKVFRARLLSPATSRKPPRLPGKGPFQVVDWVLPVLRESDIDMLETAGLDAVIFTRFLMFCVQLMVPTCVVMTVVLIPTNAKGGASSMDCQGYQGESDQFLRLSISNICDRSPIMWVHFAMVYLFVGWAMFLLSEHYAAYVNLIHYHMSVLQPPNMWMERNLPTERTGGGGSSASSLSDLTSLFTSRSLQGVPSTDRSDRTPPPSSARTGTPAETPRSVTSRLGAQAARAAVGSPPAGPAVDEHEAAGTFRDVTVSPLSEPPASAEGAGRGGRDPDSGGAAGAGTPPLRRRRRRPRFLVKQWMAPGIVLNGRGEVPAPLQRVAALHGSLRRASTPLPRSASDPSPPATPRDPGASPQLEAEWSGPAGAARKSSVGFAIGMDLEAAELPDSPSIAAHKWWEIEYHSDDDAELCNGEGMKLVKPSIRHLKFINASRHGVDVGVSAENYAVLVMDVPDAMARDLNFVTPRPGHARHGSWGAAGKGSGGAGAPGPEALSDKAPPVTPGKLTTRSQHIRNRSGGGHGDALAGWGAHLAQLTEGAALDGDGPKPKPTAAAAPEEELAVDDPVSEAFASLFPGTFQEAVPVRDFRPVTRALLKWDTYCQKLETLKAREQQTGAPPMGRTGFLGLFGERVALIPRFERLVRESAQTIKEARRDCLKGPPSGSRILLFNSQHSATIASQVALFPVDGTKYRPSKAPGPDNLYWPTILMSKAERTLRSVCVLPLIVFIMLLPAGLILSIFPNLSHALCVGTPETNDFYWEWWCKKDDGDLFHQFVTGIVISWVSPIILVVYQTVILMRVLYYIAAAEGKSVSLGGMDLRILDLYFYWDFFNIFLGAVLSNSIFYAIPVSIQKQEWQYVLTTLGTRLTMASTFMIQYVSLRALLMVPFKLIFPHPGVLSWSLRQILLRLGFRSRLNLTYRQRYMSWQPKSFMYGKEYGIVFLVGMMSIIYCVVAPLILVFGAIFFMLAYIVYKHHLLYVYSRAYESQGSAWPTLFNSTIFICQAMIFFTAAQFLVKGAFFQAAILVLTLPFALWHFRSYCQRRFQSSVQDVPLEIAKAMPRTSIPRELFIPSELRPESAGWHPENGKAWQGYGVPYFTL